MKSIFRRKPKAKVLLCAWMGCWGKSSEPAVAVVTTTRDCGHSGASTYTCQKHIGELHLTGGKSKVPIACADCGKVCFSRVTKVEDLDV